MKLPMEKTLRILLTESFLHRKFVVITFFLLLLTALALGWYWPKSYTSYATIIVDEKNIITPLMQGAAVPTDVVDRARLAREIVNSRKITNQLIDSLGLAPAGANETAREKIMDDVRRNTNITNVGTNLIRVEYKDSDPERAYRINKKLVEFFIAENIGTKSRESATAFQFIDAQVKEYQTKLQRAEDNIKQFRTGALRPRNDGNRETREQSLHSRLEQTQLEIKEAEIKRATLEAQIAGALESEVDNSGERELRTRLQQMQGQLATLRQNYQDTYPDVVRLKGEIEEAKRALAAEQKTRQGRGGATAGMDETSVSQMRQQLRQDLMATQTQLAGLRARLTETQKLLASEADTGKRSIGGATLSELMRDYEVNQTILDDLLKRRENARVSMNLDRERQGLSFRVHDEAAIPTRPSGPLFIHFAIGGFFIALLAPFGMLYLKHQLDSRIRSDVLIRENMNLPVIATVPHLATPKEAGAQVRGLQWLGVLAFSIVFIVISIVLSGGKA